MTLTVTLTQVVFLLVAGLILGAALMVVTARKVLHSALFLVVALFGVAVVYAILQAGFFSVVQVVVYIGAITMLIIFVVMLTRQVMQARQPQENYLWWAPAGAALVLFGGLAGVLLTWAPFRARIGELANPGDTIVTLGQALVNPEGFVLPFEVASVLLLAALIGAIYIGWDRHKPPPVEQVEGRQP